MWLLCTFITLCAVIAVALWWLKQNAWVLVSTYDYNCISRLGVQHRVAVAQKRQGKLMVFRWPFLEKINNKLDSRDRQINFSVVFDDNDYKVRTNWCVKYHAIKKDAVLAIKNQSSMVAKLVDCVREQAPIISQYVDKQQKQLYQATLHSEVESKLHESLSKTGWKLVAVDVLSCKVLSIVSMDTTYTKQVMQLLAEDDSSRALSWWQQLGALLAKANFDMSEDSIRSISSSLRAIHISPPDDESAEVTPKTLLSILESCLQQGVGCAITENRSTEPLIILSFIQVYALLNNKVESLLFNTELKSPPAYNEEDKYIPMGDPGEDLLPLVMRNALYSYLKALNIDVPKTTLVAKVGGDFSMSLAFNVFREQFQSDDDYNGFVRQFYWYLPADTPIVALSDKSQVVPEMVALQHEDSSVESK